MNESFSVGEIAELIYARYHEQPGPVDVRITDPLAPHFDNIARKSVMGYVIELDGFEYYALPEQLRKKRPPQDPAYVKFRASLSRQELWLEDALKEITKEIAL